MSNDMEHDAGCLVQKPLIIACSGGGGHLSAAESLLSEFKSQKNMVLPSFQQIRASQRAKSWLRKLLIKSIIWNSTPGLKLITHTLLTFFKFNYLPSWERFQEELNKIEQIQINTPQRSYIDLLLDIYPAGHEFAAIFNALQVHDEVIAIHKAINSQPQSDRWHYKLTYKFIFDHLQENDRKSTPYTQIISTQPQALPAICDAIIAYNKLRIHGQALVLVQYITDLPTPGAVHFLTSLNKLNNQQRQHVQLKLISNDQNFLNQFPLINHEKFNNIECISPEKNRLIRAGFHKPNLKRYLNREIPLVLPFINEKKEQAFILVQPNDRILSMRLGAQGGMALLDYVEILLKYQIYYDHVFVFRGANTKIDEGIAKLKQIYPKWAGKIHCLCMQTDAEMPAILTRSNVIITRAGGLSLMEQLALPFQANQQIFIHHPYRNQHNEWSTGLTWEDANTYVFTKYITNQGGFVKPTDPSTILAEL